MYEVVRVSFRFLVVGLFTTRKTRHADDFIHAERLSRKKPLLAGYYYLKLRSFEKRKLHKRIECLKFAEEVKCPNIRVLLTVGCTLPVSSAEAEPVTDLIKSSATGCPKKRASRELLCIQNSENNTKTEKYLSSRHWEQTYFVQNSSWFVYEMK